ncbi:MAG: ABC transporter permease [Thermoanaerobaculia bacterium]
MLSRETFETALHRFRTHPVQMALTLAGLVVGTSAIILIVALGLTGRAFVMAQIEGVGSHLVWADYQGTVTSGVSRTLADDINDGDARAIAARTDLFNGVTPLVKLQGQVSVLSRATNLNVLGTTPNYPVIRRNVKVVQGRFLDDDDLRERAKVCVVNRPLYDQLFGRDESPEKTIRTLGMTFLVVGVFEKPMDTMGQGEVIPESIFIPITVSWFFTTMQRVDLVFAEARDFGQIERAARTVEEILRDRHHEGSVYRVKTMTTVVKVARAISFGLIVVFIVAAAISVVVGAVGIMNILLASVEQRTREIGLRMSIGARRRDILQQFLLEALMLGVVGSSLGVLVGVGVPLVSRLVFRQVSIEVSAASALFAFVFSCAVTVLFGIVPAYRAATLNPTEALRHE